MARYSNARYTLAIALCEAVGLKAQEVTGLTLSLDNSGQTTIRATLIPSDETQAALGHVLAEYQVEVVRRLNG